jgi:hypothetical protein
VLSRPLLSAFIRNMKNSTVFCCLIIRPNSNFSASWNTLPAASEKKDYERGKGEAIIAVSQQGGGL